MKKEEKIIDEKDLEIATKNVNDFIDNFLKNVSDKQFDFSVETIYRPEWHGTLSQC